jgi:HAD superfamily hydrolase (TIGR01509 family)
MLSPKAIIFDFDGVLLESEFESNQHLAHLLTELGHPTQPEEALANFSGLAGKDFIAAIEARIGTELPPEFRELRKQEAERALRDGIAAVEGAIDFVRSLPEDMPKAVASSSSTNWIRTHLEKLGLADAFGRHLYSGAEHVERGKPAPDLYLHAAGQLAVPIDECVVIEDSEVGATGALASGATVIGLAAGLHCLDGHADRLRALGVEHIAHSFEYVRRLLGLE